MYIVVLVCSCVVYLQRFVDIWIWKGREADVDTFWERHFLRYIDNTFWERPFLRYIDKYMHVSFVFTEDDSG